MSDIEQYQEYVLDALDVIEFQLIRSKADLDKPEQTFHPDMAHQIFGDAESIFGYRNLRVRLLYTAGPLHIYIGCDYEQKVDALTDGVIKADDVVATIAEKLPDGCYFVNMSEFLKTLDKANKFQPFGEKLCEYRAEGQDGQQRLFEIYHCDDKQPAFIKFFQRLQTFVLWFVDAAQYIDVDDSLWSYFVCYEKYQNDNGDTQYATVGYTTVYQYYGYPEHMRPRISQLLVLPPFQKLRIGTKFVETVYQYYQTFKNVIDITVEDPSDDFVRLRNFVDARLCMQLKSFSREQLRNGYNKEMAKEAREVYKINPRQSRIIYEILRLYYTNKHDDAEYTNYRLNIKQRLNANYYKQLNDIKKMEKHHLDTEWLRARLPDIAKRMEQLQEEYTAVETEYEAICEKLKSL